MTPSLHPQYTYSTAEHIEYETRVQENLWHRLPETPGTGNGTTCIENLPGSATEDSNIEFYIRTKVRSSDMDTFFGRIYVISCPENKSWADHAQRVQAEEVEYSSKIRTVQEVVDIAEELCTNPEIIKDEIDIGYWW